MGRDPTRASPDEALHRFAGVLEPPPAVRGLAVAATGSGLAASATRGRWRSPSNIPAAGSASARMALDDANNFHYIYALSPAILTILRNDERAGPALARPFMSKAGAEHFAFRSSVAGAGAAGENDMPCRAMGPTNQREGVCR